MCYSMRASLTLLALSLHFCCAQTSAPELLLQTGHTIIHGMTLSPDGALLAACGDDELSVKIWDVESGRMLREFRQPASFWDKSEAMSSQRRPALWFSPDGHWIFLQSINRPVLAWDLTNGDPIQRLAGDRPPTLSAFSASGRLLAVADAAGAVTLWAGTSQQKLHDFPAQGPRFQVRLQLG